MTQGRNTKPATMLACVLVALSIGALVAPALAGAQAANEEYSLKVPGGGAQSASGGGGHGGGAASDGGGAPVALIGLAAIAAACVGVAAWRLRGRDDDGSAKLRTGAPSPTGESQ